MFVHAILFAQGVWSTLIGMSVFSCVLQWFDDFVVFAGSRRIS
jgi:hypothetical protein